MKRLIVLGLLLIVPLTSVLAEAPRSWNHHTNPALLSVRNRRLIEIGVSEQMGAGNNYFTAKELFVPNLVLDITKISEELGENDLRFAMMTSGESHAVISLVGISAGWYASVDGTISGGIPSSLLALLAEGNTMGEKLSDKSPVIGRVFADVGVYAGLRWQRQWHFGMKVGAFAPLLYTDPDSGIGFEFSTDKNTGTTTLDAGLNMTAYSALNYDDLQIESPDDLLAYMNGRKIDLGVIRADGRWPLYGVNLSGITLKPAVVDTKMEVNATASLSVNNPLGNFDNDDVEYLTQEMSEVEPQFTTGDGTEISMPLHFGGFYRFTKLPIVDVIGHGQVYLTDPKAQLTVGALLEGSFFPLNMFSFGLEWDRVAWETILGMRLNLWLAELGVDIGLSSPRFGDMFAGSGISGKVYFAVGL